MKKIYKISIILALVIVIIGGVFLLRNKVDEREIVLTDFKQEQEYQFGNIPWNSSVEEVEDLLDCVLEDVTVHSPEKDYTFYDFSDVIYVLNGYEAKASVEFRADELVYIDFTFKELENFQEFAQEIISVWKNKYGPESKFNQNETTGFVSYRWLTETTQLGITFNDEMVRIYLNLRNDVGL